MAHVLFAIVAMIALGIHQDLLFAQSCESSFVHGINTDIQVTRTKLGVAVGPSIPVDAVGHLSAATCDGNDCTKHLERLTQMPIIAPVFIYDGFEGYFLEIQVALKIGAYRAPSFKGIGFWTNVGGMKAIPSMHMGLPLMQDSLSDGTPVHIFSVGLVLTEAFVKTGQQLLFKPFAEFKDDGQRHFMWEAIEGNHVVGGQNEFDMQRDIVP